MEYRNMPQVDTRRHTKRQMGQTHPENERKHTGDKTKRMGTQTLRGKNSSNAHKGSREGERKDSQKCKTAKENENELLKKRQRETNRKQSRK